MIRKRWLIICALSLLAVILGANCPVWAADEPVQTKITSYQANIEVDANGQMQVKEQIDYQFNIDRNHLEHFIPLSNQAEVHSLEIGLKATGANQAFPFAESISEQIGTYSLRSDPNGLGITLFNHMGLDPHTGFFNYKIDQVWQLAKDTVVISQPFASLPYPSDKVTLTFHFPQALTGQKNNFLVAPQDNIEAAWLDGQTFQVTARNLTAQTGIKLEMYLPASMFTAEVTPGAASHIDGVVTRINKFYQDQAAAKQARHRHHVWLVVGLSLASLVVLGLTIWGKNRAKQDTVAQSQSVDWPLASLAQLVGKQNQTLASFWLTLFDMTSKGQLALKVVADDQGQVGDLYWSDLGYEPEFPGERLLLSTLKDQNQTSIKTIITNNQGLGSKLKKAAQQYLADQGAYVPANSLLKGLWLLNGLALLVGAIYLGWQIFAWMDPRWPLFVCLVLLLVMAGAYYWLLPIYSAKAQSVGKWVDQLGNQSGRNLEVLLTNYPDEDAYTMIYLLSWIYNNQAQYGQTIRRLYPLTYDSIINSLAPLEGRKLNKLLK
ncbi:hypothetical protein AWM75_05665 [Aerococcus urinaehominis]|uniref:Uncharacterized protein n=1 Tax=Aerococcus urinaehominis TaxID=128944 RepID=A0A0X8FLY0_9LACT|nr:DUF2207 domain-containing protein [Aerococcus urinaehominis]AMB99514.1 hypothetical protein AWM75_05665 [Aerococcus urinaehominis]SDM25766.1 Predicted membrane protein [Aerococcus urinaehominis]